MRDHTKLRAVELADELAVSVPSIIVDLSLLEARIVDTEKVLNGLIRAL